MDSLDPTKYTLIRLDGHGFSQFVKRERLSRPFDERFTTAMKIAATAGFKYFNIKIGYVGSDEITYCIKPIYGPGGILRELPFSGRKEKFISLLAGYISVEFYKAISSLMHIESSPHFDCRVWQVETAEGVLHNIKERIVYTEKNARMMWAQHYIPHRELQGVSSTAAVAMVTDRYGLNYDSIPESNRLGNIIVEHTSPPALRTTIVRGVETLVSCSAKSVVLECCSPEDVVKYVSLLQSVGAVVISDEAPKCDKI